MSRAFNTSGGGANTNVNGLEFERTTSLREALAASGRYQVRGDSLIDTVTGHPIAYFYEKNKLYNNLFPSKGVKSEGILSKKLLPDEALLNGDTLYIIEKKYQASAGSVDEKLQTCHFKLKQYEKLMKPLGFKVKYFYVLNDWFKHAGYSDVLDYIKSINGCNYYFNTVPYEALGLAPPIEEAPA